MSHSTHWLKGLNPQQCEAAAHNFGPLLILAGAGSGKTTVLVARTGRLISEKVAAPEEVLVLTFTNKAARELKERVAKKIGKIGKDIWAGTFHSFGLQILRENHKLAELPKRFAIIDTADARSLVKEVLKDIYHGEKVSFDTDVLISAMGYLREGREIPPDIHPNDAEVAEMVLPRYLEKMQMWGAIDFEGLLLKPLELFERYPDLLHKYQSRFRQVMVDEFQDTNKVQMKLIEKLTAGHNNISVVGDDDQSIYGWRGAVISNILKFPERFKGCKVVRLEMNYRSTAPILNFANLVIEKNNDRHKKTLKPFHQGTENCKPELFTYENDDEEIEEIITQIRHFQRQGFQLKDMAVLFRSNSQGGLLEGVLRQNQIEYSMSGGTGFFDRKEIRDVFAYIRSSVNPSDLSLRRVLNTPARGIGPGSYELLEKWASEKGISFNRALKNAGEIKFADTEKEGEEITLSVKALQSMEHFLGLLKKLRELLLDASVMDYSMAIPKFFNEIGYRDYVYNSYKDGATAQKKWQLVEVLGRIIDKAYERNGKSLKTLDSFIDAMELRDQEDEGEGGEVADKIQLLTLHACKGLEFPVVIMIGNEEGLIPHERLGSDVSEERRLFYVGVTRAQKHLVLTKARKRKRYGKWRNVSPTRFLVDLDEELYTHFENGFRPLQESDRKSLLADLYKKLEK